MAREFLARSWTTVKSGEGPQSSAVLPELLQESIKRSINSKTKTYRYVLPAQLLAKAVDPAIDCRCVQVSSGVPGAFDARSLCHKVVVPFDRENNAVLGGSTEPYANNPLRIPAIARDARTAQKDKSGFDDLCAVLEFAQSNPLLVETLLFAALRRIHDRLGRTQITYPVPNRIALRSARKLLSDFLTERTGGERLQAVVVSLFRYIGTRFSLFAEIRSGATNASDASTGLVADLECLDANGNVALAVEVKDRTLTLRHAEDKLPTLRSQGVRELLFLVQGGIETSDTARVEALIDAEFGTGQNIYVCEFAWFLDSCLVLIGEAGRRELLQAIGVELDSRQTELRHRERWRGLLAEM